MVYLWFCNDHFDACSIFLLSLRIVGRERLVNMCSIFVVEVSKVPPVLDVGAAGSAAARHAIWS